MQQLIIWKVRIELVALHCLYYEQSSIHKMGWSHICASTMNALAFYHALVKWHPIRIFVIHLVEKIEKLSARENDSHETALFCSNFRTFQKGEIKHITYIHTYVHMQVHTYACTYVQLYVHTYVHRCVNTYVYMYVHM